ncbi:hypothetical protein EBQ26_02880 [Allofranklinella schreckenbergeri]|uniref:Uncharacterized protein n=1 Tax=Allofranklinella schreckenbergeri TaxID=1076744 RepID=A0A3M6QCA1_9BURK|nr:hypothetical protein EBQ26_02880 [Allofranklinella schreckenbergeri]
MKGKGQQAGEAAGERRIFLSPSVNACRQCALKCPSVTFQEKSVSIQSTFIWPEDDRDRKR